MIYSLMHKNIPVLEMVLDDDTSVILKVTDMINPKHIPIGVRFEHGILDKKALNHWLMGRSIPENRENIAEALAVIGEHTSQSLIAKCYGLSLSDGYWICPKDVELDFDAINFFENGFSKDMGEILFGNHLEEFSLLSPDNTSDGWLKKKWIIRENRRYLVKGSSGIYKQEPFNEQIATAFCEKLGIPHVPYTVEFIDELPYSLCKNFLSKDTELVSAWSVYSHFKKPNQLSPFEHLISCYEKLGIENPRQSLEQMLVLDFLIANTDRHMNNFGIVRDSNTLKVLGVAPIFDSGTSMYMSLSKVQSAEEIDSKPFAKTHGEQIKLVSKLQELLPENLQDLQQTVADILFQNPFMDEERRDFVLANFIKRAELLKLSTEQA